MPLFRWLLGLGLTALIVAVAAIFIGILVGNADQRSDGPVWVNRLIDISGMTPLGLVVHIESIILIAGAAAFAFFVTAIFIYAIRKLTA